MSNTLNQFYPADEKVGEAAKSGSIATLQLEQKLREHLSNAVRGSRVSESALVNRLGQIRRAVPDLSQCDRDIKQVIRESAAWLRSVGRVISFAEEDPAVWITRRDGTPRW